MKEFLERFQPPFPVGWTIEAAVREYLQLPVIDRRPFYVPHMVFLDRRGTIRTDVPGESDFWSAPR